MAMDLLNETLKRLGVEDYSSLTDAEKETYQGWLRQMSSDLTVSDIRSHIDNMQRAVMIELADEPEYVYSKIFTFWMFLLGTAAFSLMELHQHMCMTFACLTCRFTQTRQAIRVFA